MDATSPRTAPSTHSSLSSSIVAQLHGGQPVAFINLPIAAVAAWVVGDAIAFPLLVAWLVLFVLVIAGRFGTSRWLRRQDATLQKQLTAHTCGATLSGLMWGVLPILLLPHGTFIDFAFCGFVIAGNASGALPSLSAHRPAYLGYMLGSTLPLAASLFALAEPPFPAMGGLVLLFAAVLVFTARHYNNTLTETLKLRDDATRLSKRLISTEDELVAADLEKWRTISHLSHELRTPLNAVIGFSEIIKNETMGPVGNAQYLNYTSHIHECGEAILHLVEELLELSEASTGSLAIKREPADFCQLVNDCIAQHREQAENARIAIVTDMHTDTAMAYVDTAKLRLAIDGILDNAIRYTPSGGQVSIIVASESADDETISIAIADTGIGMTESETEIALSPFGRIASPLIHQLPGTGIGLPLARMIVEFHGGRFDIDSTPGNGTRIIMHIPKGEAPGPDHGTKTD